MFMSALSDLNNLVDISFLGDLSNLGNLCAILVILVICVSVPNCVVGYMLACYYLDSVILPNLQHFPCFDTATQ